MNVKCESCGTVYRVDPAKVPASGTRVRCAVCPNAITVYPDGNHSVAAPAAAAPPAVPQPPAAPLQAPTAPALAPPPTAPPVVQSQPALAPARPSAPVFTPTPGTPVRAVPVAPPQPAAVPRPPVAAPAPAPIPAAAASVPPVATPASAPPIKQDTRPLPALADVPTTATPAPEAPPKAPINPFLQRDPKQKAKRLARALVSDMIVYQPDKRQKSLDAGTIKKDFDEEVKKSWEEYVGQIGEELANSTDFFTEALNEILAGGKQIF